MCGRDGLRIGGKDPLWGRFPCIVKKSHWALEIVTVCSQFVLNFPFFMRYNKRDSSRKILQMKIGGKKNGIEIE